MTNEIVLPEGDPEPTCKEQLCAALCSACVYNAATKIVRGHRVAYIVPEHVYEKWMQDAQGG